MKRPNHPIGHWESHGEGRCTQTWCAELGVLGCRRIQSKERSSVFYLGEAQCSPSEPVVNGHSQVGGWRCCQGSPKLQPLGVAQQSAAGHNPSLALLENMTEAPLSTSISTWWLLPNTTLCHNSGTVSFLERRAKVSTGRMGAIFDIGYTLQAWTPSRLSCFGWWDCPQVHAV